MISMYTFSVCKELKKDFISYTMDQVKSNNFNKVLNKHLIINSNIDDKSYFKR